MEHELDANWEVLGEPIQTGHARLRAQGPAPAWTSPYEKVKELMRGHEISRQDVERFIDGLAFDDETRRPLEGPDPPPPIRAWRARWSISTADSNPFDNHRPPGIATPGGRSVPR